MAQYSKRKTRCQEREKPYQIHGHRAELNLKGGTVEVSLLMTDARKSHHKCDQAT